MKIAGFLLLVAGWVIVIAAVLLLQAPALRAAFAFAGLAVQMLGLIFAIRSHRTMESERG